MSRFAGIPITPRRDFIRAALRYLALGGLGVLSALAVIRGGSRCINAPACNGCPRERDCDLPRARIAAARRRGDSP